MSAPKVNGTFISEKVSRVRWIPEQYAAPDSFLTGSWEYADNTVKVWRLTADTDFGSTTGVRAGGGGFVGFEDGDGGAVLVPKCIAKLPMDGDISGMEFVDADHIIVASTLGFCSVLHLNRFMTRDNLREQFRFRHLHRFAGGATAACNAVAPFEHNVATAGEDGRLNVLNVNSTQVLRTYGEGDSCSLTAVSFVSPAELFTGNRMGTIKMFDLRAQSDTPASAMLISCDDEKKSNGVTALAYHPTQRHILLGGSEEGSITVWDLRSPGYAASYLTAHDTAITELAFHPTEPHRLFTAAEGGELFQWSHAAVGGVGAPRLPDASSTANVRATETADQSNPWLSGERIKNKINWMPLVSGIRKAINTFDASGSKIICGCDNEAVYLIEQVY